MLSLSLEPDNSAASEALNDGPEDVRVGISVAVLDEDMIDSLDIRDAENIVVLRETDENSTTRAECSIGEYARTLHAPLILKTGPLFEIHSFHWEPRSSSNSNHSCPQMREAPSWEH